ncbi:MAG: transketolase [Puniceicoccales bacterium]|jgi:transketolase|nr:transketolase [Puniceicoccales bacterium]
MPLEKNKALLVAANDARGLALDAIAAANSGHLGMPMGCAEMGAALFGLLLNFDPENPTWINRDRFVLSAGHGSIFLYGWLHLAGYGISLDDIKNFRKTGSITHGHPEFNKKLGIECTTGPLGQGIGNAVGIALSCKKQAKMFNTPAHEIFSSHVICLCGDGCLQEGISSEACSLAGHWKLDNLILIFDSNGVTLDATLDKTQSEDVAKRFQSYGFEVFATNGNDLKNFTETFQRATTSPKQCPKLIIAKTIIGYGIDEIAGTNKSHGASGTAFITETKQRLGLPDEKFFISPETKIFFAQRRLECSEKYSRWLQIFTAWEQENPELAQSLKEINADAERLKALAPSDGEKMSTRICAGEILQTIAEENKFILSASADLFSSTGNYIKNGGDFSSDNLDGRNIYFGVREHAMAAIANGISCDGIFRMPCSTFLVFSDYMRGAMRIAALAKLGTIFILTHDSIAVGEDGPTHQPVETIASLRCIPGLDVVRPADYEETVGAWQLAIQNRNRPTALILSRQDLPLLSEINVEKKRKGAQDGAYVARNEIGKLERIILASGSELHLAMQAAKSFSGTRVVSMPCMEAFERQPDAYRNAILPKSCTNAIAIEAGISMPWHKYVGTNGGIIAVNDFGYSGQPRDLLNDFGITLENLKKIIGKGLE